MDLVHDEGVGRQNVSVLEPASGDPRGHDDDVPRGRFRGRFALSVHDTNTELPFQDLFGDRSNGERLPGAGAGDDAEALAGARQLANAWSVPALEERLDVKPEGKLDCLACRARWRDDDDASGARLLPHECVAVGWQPIPIRN